jgi:YD repeat-containing protein
MAGPSRTWRLVVVLLMALACRIVSAQTSAQYVYDALGRLIGIVDPAGYTATYTYDGVGNILSIGQYSSSTVSIASATTTSLAAAVPPVAASWLTVVTPTRTGTSSADFFVPPAPYVASDADSTGRGSLLLDLDISVPVTTANKIGLVVFDGPAGHRVSLKIVRGPFSTVTIYKPTGAVLATVSGGFSTTLIDPQTLTTTGTYLIDFDRQLNPSSCFGREVRVKQS